MDYFSITANMLKKMNERAHKEGLNQVLNIQDKNADATHQPVVLDKKKKVLLMSVLPFTHRNVNDKGSIRCMVLFAIEGTEEPQTGLLDVPLFYKATLDKNKVDAKALEETGVLREPVDDEPEEA